MGAYISALASERAHNCAIASCPSAAGWEAIRRHCNNNCSPFGGQFPRASCGGSDGAESVDVWDDSDDYDSDLS